MPPWGCPKSPLITIYRAYNHEMNHQLSHFHHHEMTINIKDRYINISIYIHTRIYTYILIYIYIIIQYYTYITCLDGSPLSTITGLLGSVRLSGLPYAWTGRSLFHPAVVTTASTTAVDNAPLDIGSVGAATRSARRLVEAMEKTMENYGKPWKKHGKNQGYECFRMV